MKQMRRLAYQMRTRLRTRRHLERIVRAQYDLICDLEEQQRTR
jgi:hypothetical protein